MLWLALAVGLTMLTPADTLAFQAVAPAKGDAAKARKQRRRNPAPVQPPSIPASQPAANPLTAQAPNPASRSNAAETSRPANSSIITIVSQVLTVLVIPALLVVFSVWLTIKLRDKLRIKIVASLNHRDFDELVALYLDRVPDYERVPPDHFKAFFATRQSAKSARDFCSRIPGQNEPTHVLLIAKTSHEICGFLKAIYVPEGEYLFVAYLVASKANLHEERNVAHKLLSTLLTLCDSGKVKHLVFEICCDPGTREHEAKARLFRHYARAHALRLMQVDAPYFQPEICSFDVGGCGRTEAQLFVADVPARPPQKNPTITKPEFTGLVASIYKNIYLDSFRLADPDSAASYEEFLERLSSETIGNLRQEAICLR